MCMQAAERADDAHARAAQWPIYLRPADLPTVGCFQDSQRERERSDDGSPIGDAVTMGEPSMES